MSQSTVVPLFKNRTLGSAVLEDGTVVAFANKQFYTTDENLIARLKKAAEKGEFGIYIDPTDPDIDTEAATPMERLRKQMRAELMAELNSGKAPVVAPTSSAKPNTVASVGSTVSMAPEQQNPELNKAAPSAATEQLNALEQLKQKAQQGNS